MISHSFILFNLNIAFFYLLELYITTFFKVKRHMKESVVWCLWGPKAKGSKGTYVDAPFPFWLPWGPSLTILRLLRPSLWFLLGSWPTSILSFGWFRPQKASRFFRSTCSNSSYDGQSSSIPPAPFWSMGNARWKEKKYVKVSNFYKSVVYNLKINVD